MNVATESGGAGPASTLMRTIIGAMSQRGLKLMEGFVLAENEPMLRLARRSRIHDRALDPGTIGVLVSTSAVLQPERRPGGLNFARLDRAAAHIIVVQPVCVLSNRGRRASARGS